MRPSRALDSPCGLLPELQRNNDTVRCGGPRTPSTTDATLIVHLLKTHFFTPILDLKSQQNRIELVTRPGDNQDPCQVTTQSNPAPREESTLLSPTDVSAEPYYGTTTTSATQLSTTLGPHPLMKGLGVPQGTGTPSYRPSAVTQTSISTSPSPSGLRTS